MAEYVGLASGLLTLATFAFQSSITLSKTVQSFQSHPKQVRDLKEELEALTDVLHSLTETIGATTDVDFSALDLPLLRCGNACKEFEEEIVKCSSRSGGNRKSFRDWTKVKYMGDDIDGFRRLLAGYKSTIIIALTDANLHVSSVTTESLTAYKELIETATGDLETHLRSIDDKLETIFGRTVPGSSSDATELQRIKDERLSTQKCLQICAQLSDHINQIELIPDDSSIPAGPLEPDTVSGRLTVSALQECKNSLAITAAKLEQHMINLVDRLVTKSKGSTSSDEEYADLARLRDEWETARQCMNICSKADTHLKTNISTIDNYGTGDAIQFMVSTDGNIINGRNRGLGWRTRQVGGHLSDLSVQKISGDFTNTISHNTRTNDLSSKRNTPSVPADGMEHRPASGIQERYGHGYKLPSWTPADTSSADSAGGARGR